MKKECQIFIGNYFIGFGHEDGVIDYIRVDMVDDGKPLVVALRRFLRKPTVLNAGRLMDVVWSNESPYVVSIYEFYLFMLNLFVAVGKKKRIILRDRRSGRKEKDEQYN